MSTRELITICRNLQELYIRGSFADLVTYQRECKRVLSPYEHQSVIQAFDAWLARRDNKPELTLVKD